MSIGGNADGVDPGRFLSETAAFHTRESSAAGVRYERVHPAPGFDRLTSNCPHFSFGTTSAPPTRETTAMAAMARLPASQWCSKSEGPKAARSDLGTSYNICNFESSPNSTKQQPAHAVNDMPYWMRHSNDKKAPQTKRRCKFNVVTCQQVDKEHPPPKTNSTRKEKPPLRSLIAVRPPSP